MSAKHAISANSQFDPDDDAPEWTRDQFARAEFRIGDTVIREAQGTLTKRSRGERGPGKKPARQSVTLRIEPDVLAYYRGTGPGWQTRMTEILAANAGLGKGAK